jgi:putative tricarboxylic transport membrane protein
MMLIPDLVMDRHNFSHIKTDHFEPADNEERTWWTISKSTVIGLFSGLVPGPSAETASALAYHAHKKKGRFHQIVAAETANNPGVVMMLLPFFTMGLPITASALIISTVLDVKNIDIVDFAASSSMVFTSISVFDVVIFVATIATIFYYLLSTRLVDMNINETPVWLYTILLLFFTAFGIWLKYKCINPILFIFGTMFGDKLIWTLMQFTSINF